MQSCLEVLYTVSLLGFWWKVGDGVEERDEVREVKRRMEKRSREDGVIFGSGGGWRRRRMESGRRGTIGEGRSEVFICYCKRECEVREDAAAID